VKKPISLVLASALAPAGSVHAQTPATPLGYRPLAHEIVRKGFGHHDPNTSTIDLTTGNKGEDNDRFSSIFRAGRDGHRTIHK
jgi:hypothetical protein